MSNIKGCVNPKCIAYQKKKVYKKEDQYCLKCGEKLQFVCKKCRMQITEADKNYCVRCKAAMKDKKEERVQKAKERAAVVAPVVIAAIGKGKTVIQNIKR